MRQALQLLETLKRQEAHTRCLRVRTSIEVGELLRDERLERKKGLRETARALGISAPYLSDLELGRRGWSPRLVAAYTKALR